MSADPIKCLPYKGFSSVVSLGTLEAGVPSTELDTHGVHKVRPVFDISSIGQSVTFGVDGQIDPDDEEWFSVMPDQVFTTNGKHSFVIDCEAIRRIRFVMRGFDGDTPTVTVTFTVGNSPIW